MDKIVITCDHRGDEFCTKINEYLLKKGYFTNLILSQGPKDDYVDNAKIALKMIKDKKFDWGIFVCGTGIGMAICANRVKGVFAVHAKDDADAYFARRHENSKVLALGCGYSDGVHEVKMNISKAKKIIDTFLTTAFEGDRHNKRIEKVDK